MTKSFFELRESVVNSADKKSEKYVGPDGKTKVRMVPVDKQVVKNEAKDGDGANIVRDREFKGKSSKTIPYAKPGDSGYNTRDSMFKKDGPKPAWMKRAGMKEEVELDEAVEVSHDRYMRSHGKKASGGHGMWIFTHKRMGDANLNDPKEVHSASGKFSDAKKSAQQWAKKHGHSTVYVMEEVELDESFASNMNKAAKKAQTAAAEKIKKMGPVTRDTLADINAKLGNTTKKEEVELDEAKIKVGDIVKPSKSSAKTMKVTDIVRVPYMGRKVTFVNGIDDQGNKLRRPLRSVVKEEAELDEVLDTPKAMDSYRNKAKYSKDRAANSAAAKMLRDPKGFHSTDTSDELKTMDKRTKGLKMADKAAARKTRAMLMKKEEAELDEAEMSLYDKIKAARANPSPDKPVRGRGSKNRNPKTYDQHTALDKEDDRIQATIKKRLKKEDFDLSDFTLDELEDFMMSEEFTQLDEVSKKTLASYIRKASDDRAHNAFEVGKTGKINFKGLKRRQGINRATARLAKESVELDEGLGHISAIQNMMAKEREAQAKKKYTAPTQAEIDADHKKDQRGKSRPSMSAKSVTRKTYGNMMGGLKTEEYVNEKLKVSHGMGAWVDDFKKSDAPQFKDKSDKERRDMAIAAYLSAKREQK